MNIIKNPRFYIINCINNTNFDSERFASSQIMPDATQPLTLTSQCHKMGMDIPRRGGQGAAPLQKNSLRSVQSLIIFTEFGGGGIAVAAEGFYEIVHVVETALFGNVVNRHIS